MFRSDFTFLEMMFPYESCWDYTILIINQTDEQRQLVSDHKNVRVINTLERGLSRSRNMALDYAIGEICLIADDDVRYEQNVEEIVVSAFAKAKKATFITFQKKNIGNAGFKKYPAIREHNLRTAQNVSSWEIAFNLNKIKTYDVRFSEYFGLGAIFPIGEESLFVCDILHKGGAGLLETTIILTHPEMSSGQFPGRNDIVFARGALRYKRMGKLAYLSMIKYAWFYYRRGEIKFYEIPSKIATAFAGIKKYKNLQQNS